MKIFSIVAALVLIAGVGSGCASAPEENVASNPDDDLICTHEHVVGSRMPKKVCMTAAERRALARQTTEEITNRQRSESVIGTGGPDIAGPGQ